MPFAKCICPHCGQSIEYPAEGTGQTVPCPTCDMPFVLTPVNPPTYLHPAVTPPAPALKKSKARKPNELNFSDLTEETIRVRKNGNTPLHRAAQTGRIAEIPRNLLTAELFLIFNEFHTPFTPIHLAAKHGQLDKVPSDFLTKETLTASIEYEKKESRTGPTPPRTRTPLHVAADEGHADQIPKKFLTPEYLTIEATGYRDTVLHRLAYAGRLDLVPKIYADSEMWNLKNSSGLTPQGVFENERATEKQKVKLRSFGYAFGEEISKKEAGVMFDQYYDSKPPSKEQLEKIERLGISNDLPPNATMRDARNLLFFAGDEPPTKKQLKWFTDEGFKVVKGESLTASGLDAWAMLRGTPAATESTNYLSQYGCSVTSRDGFITEIYVCLIQSFERLVDFGGEKERERIIRAGSIAVGDPRFLNITFKADTFCFDVVASWPNSLVREWFRKAKS